MMPRLIFRDLNAVVNMTQGSWVDHTGGWRTQEAGSFIDYFGFRTILA
jgi:hypothetical protein